MWKTQPASKQVNGLALSRTGSGPSILFLHGVGLRQECWNLMKTFMDGYECLSIDLPGHGLSDDMDVQIKDVGDLTDSIYGALSIKPDYLIGHSLGSLIAVDWAARYPGNLKGVVGLNALYDRSESVRHKAMARAASVSESTTIDPTITLERWFWDKPSPERQACRDWLTSNRLDQYAQAYWIFARSFGAEYYMLQNLSMPSLFITGALEPNSTPKMSQTMANIAPQGHSYIVEGAAHMAPMTHAAEIAAEIRGFFQAFEVKLGIRGK